MELAENQVRNVPHTLQKQRGSPTCPAPPCDFHCIHGRGPRAHCMPGSKVSPLHPRGHPGYPATSRHLGNLLRPFFQPASPGGFKLGAPFDLLKECGNQIGRGLGECRRREGWLREEAAAPSQSVAMATPGREAGWLSCHTCWSNRPLEGTVVGHHSKKM